MFPRRRAFGRRRGDSYYQAAVEVAGSREALDSREPWSDFQGFPEAT